MPPKFPVLPAQKVADIRKAFGTACSTLCFVIFSLSKSGGPGLTRTGDPSFRKRMLYPD